MSDAPAYETANDGVSEPTTVGGVNVGQLRSFIERIERLEEEKQALMADIREVFAEAKANGYDVKIMRQVLKLRRMDNDDRAEEETLLEVYKRALGPGEIRALSRLEARAVEAE